MGMLAVRIARTSRWEDRCDRYPTAKKAVSLSRRDGVVGTSRRRFFVALFPPTRSLISGGPMAPAYAATDVAWAAVTAPFHFAAQNELLTDRNRQIVTLQKQVADDKTQLGAKQA